MGKERVAFTSILKVIRVRELPWYTKIVGLLPMGGVMLSIGHDREKGIPGHITNVNVQHL